MLNYFETLTDLSGNSLLGATLAVQGYPSGSATIYQTNGTGSPVANSTVASDITGQVSFYIPDGVYTFVYTYQGTIYKTKTPVQILDPSGFVSVTDTGTANTYAVNSPVLPAQLFVGLKVEFIAANTNNGASTLNVNATGAQPLTLPASIALTPGAIQAAGIYRVEWDGTQWQLVSTTSSPVAASTAIVYLITAPEIAAGVTPVNLWVESHLVSGRLNVLRYGNNTTPGTTNMLPAFQAAHSVGTNAGGGTITGPPQTYYLANTFAITGPVGMDFGDAQLSYTAGTGAILYSTSNNRILTVDNPTNRASLRNFNIAGATGAGSSQIGLSVGHGGSNTPIDCENIGIFNCGGIGLSAEFTVGSSFRNVYAQGCTGNGISTVLNQGGANKWYNCSGVACHTGLDLGGAGADTYYGIIAEQNAYGVVFESGAIGHIMIGLHTEANNTNSLLFQSGSNRNRVDFESWGGGAEPSPSNLGGAQNRWSGTGSNSILYDAKLVQRVSTLVSAVVTGSSNPIPYTTAVPTTSTGLPILSQSITPQATGNRLVVRAWGFFEVSATTAVATVALFETGSSNAIYAQGQAYPNAAVPVMFSFEHEVAATSTGAVTFTVNAGSDGAGTPTTTFGGHAGAIKYSGIVIGGITVEEFYPSSG